MAVSSPVQIDPQRIQELAAREEAQLNERTPGSGAMYERAKVPLSDGVASSYQLRDPWPIYLDARRGARGLGRRRQPDAATSTTASARWCRGTPTRRSEAPSRERYALGTHFAAPTEDAVVVAEELAAPLGPPQVALHELGLRVDDGRDPDRARPTPAATRS